MRRNLSITTAAAALLVGTVFAAAQGVQRPGGAEPGAQQGQGGTQMAPQQDGGKGKAQTKEPRTQGQGGQTQGQQGQAAPEPKEPKGKAQSKEPGTPQQQQGQQPKQQQGQQTPQQGQQPKQQQGQQTPPDTQKTQKGAEGKGGGDKSGANVKLTQEQRTTIRTTVIQGSNAPRVNNVNFSLNVGTAVPRTGVTLVVVPPTLVQIYPAWSGYRYFIVGERIIIVDPNSYEIVAVLVV
jgi:hypothetical protein